MAASKWKSETGEGETVHDAVVISGISGRFPESANMTELQANLLQHVDMVTINETRFKPGIYGIPAAFGSLNEIDKFDAEYFNILPGQASRMDPQLRIAMETVTEAMLDAGVNPGTQRGTRTGVFYGVCANEANNLWNHQPNRVKGVTMLGCQLGLFPNRISYAYDFKGPSCAYDTACSSSLVALEAAVSALRAGKCDAALVVASTLMLFPLTTLQFDKLGMLSQGAGRCRSFDSGGDGYARAESVVAIYLQRESVAKRQYAAIVHVGTNTDGYKQGGVTYPSAAMQAELMRQVYAEANVHVDQVAFVEAHGTGTAVGDPQEMAALAKVFLTPTRTKPLLVGSIKSNLGHAEAAAGLCGIAKIVTILQSRMIPANLHYENPIPRQDAIRTGAIRVVNENMPWEGGHIGLSSFGFGGVNVHVILKPVEGELAQDEATVPKLVLVSGRTEEGVAHALKEVKRLGDNGMATLLNDINKAKMMGMQVRGFSLWGAEHERKDIEVKVGTGSPGPIWFVFNGMGSHWPGMGKDLLQIPEFAASIDRSAAVLKQHVGFDLMSLMLQQCDTDTSSYDNPTNCFVTIAAIQIALVDTLASIGIRPHGMVGHSAGEMLCAYADECLTAEQTILCSYWRGETLKLELDDVTKETENVEYGMAAVSGMSWEQVQKLLSKFPGVYAACHNAAESVTISGPRKQIEELMATLTTKKNKMAKMVASCGIAFHSPYVYSASQQLRERLQAIITTPQVRSAGWISSSIPEGQWDSALCSTASAEYTVNNLVSPVLFHEAVQRIPPGAVVIEIGPSGLLRGLIAKTLLPSAATVVALQSRSSKNGMTDFVAALGKLFLAGVNFDANKLMIRHAAGSRAAAYPVPVVTPCISPLMQMQWDHSTSWDVPTYGKNGEFLQGVFDVDMADPSNAYLLGHQVQGRVLYPATGYVVLVWKLFAQMNQTPYDKMAVVLEHVRFTRVAVLMSRTKVEFRVQISDISGTFEIKESGAVICTGVIRKYNEEAMEERMRAHQFHELEKQGVVHLSETKCPVLAGDIYKRMRLGGFEYGGLFQGIEMSDLEGSAFVVAWKGNWVSFLDTFLHTTIRGAQIRTELPTQIGKLVLVPEQLTTFLDNNHRATETGVFVWNDTATGLIKCWGVEATGLRTTAVNSSVHSEPSPSLCKHVFTPYFTDDPLQIDAASDATSPLVQCVNIVSGNLGSRMTQNVPTILEIADSLVEGDTLEIHDHFKAVLDLEIEYTWTSIQNPLPELVDTLARLSVYYADYAEVTREPAWRTRRFDLVVLGTLTPLHIAMEFLKKGSFILLKLPAASVDKDLHQKLRLNKAFRLVAHKFNALQHVFLIRKSAANQRAADNIQSLQVSSQDLSWVPQLKELMLERKELQGRGDRPPLVYLVSKGIYSGLLGLILSLRKEPFAQHLRCIIVTNPLCPLDLDFSNPAPWLADLLANDLAINIMDNNGRLGFYIHAPINAQAKCLADNAFVGMETVGDFTSFNWIQGFDLRQIQGFAAQYVVVNVEYAALNFKDVMMATGNLQPEMRRLPYNIDSALGIEFSGRTEDGERVFGFSEGQSLSTQVLANREYLWTIPKEWTFEEAATVCVVYSTVYFALIMRGQLQPGESVLIHTGAGGIGLAAIRVAQSLNCEIFTTVGTKEKAAFLRKQFPGIAASHIGSSRDTDFEMMVLKATKGRGVDVVLNSLTGDKLQAGIRCVARHGRFLELGKVDLVSDKQMGMALFLRDASFHGVMLDSLWDSRPEPRAEFWRLVEEGIGKGVVVPLPRRVFQKDQVEPAFRFMGQGTQIGKVLIQIGSDKQPAAILATSRVYFHPEKVYIIVGGLGGVGLELCNWMTTRYARKLVLTTRSGVSTAYQQQYLDLWQSKGVTCRILTLDASEFANAERVVMEALTLGPVGGFFNLGMELAMGLMKTQTEEDFARVINPKINLSRHMDQLTRQLCPELDHFVLFSSIAAGQGLDGSSNYGMANSGMDRLSEQRVRDGLPSKALQWGPIGHVGSWHTVYNADFQKKNYRGSGVQSIQSVLQSLDILLTNPEPVLLSRRHVDMERGGKQGVNQQLSLLEGIAHILGHSNLARVDPKSKLTELGMDSLMVMEVTRVLDQDFGLELSAVQIRNCTLEELTEMSKNCKTVQIVASNQPKLQAATKVRLFNFMANRPKFFQEKCVYKINGVEDCGKGVVFICNSIDSPDVLSILGNLIDRPTYAVQFAKGMPFDSIENVSDYFLRKLKSVSPHGPYIIAGYSAGTFPAIELAIRLEALGQLPEKLILLDMTPARFSAIVDENFGKDRGKLDGNDCVVFLFSEMFDLDIEDLERLIKTLPDKEAVTEKLLELAGELFGTDKEMNQLIQENAGNILNVFDQYRPTEKYGGQVMLIRTTQNLICFDSESTDWGLDEFCTQCPTVLTVETTHSFMVAEPAVHQLAAAFNCHSNLRIIK